MGLYYSTRQGLNLIHYYRRRLLRIFPLYFAVVGIFSLLAGDSFLTYILKATTIGWWTSGATIGWWTPGDWYDWFIPNLILLYLTFPLFHAAVHNHRNGLLIGSVIVVGLYICVSFIPYGSFSIQFLRWPTFFLGALLGYAIFTSGDKRRIIDNILTDTTARGGVNKTCFAVTLIAFVVALATTIWVYAIYVVPITEYSWPPEYVKNGWLFRPYFFLVIPFCILAAKAISLPICRHIRHLLSLVGSMSLEVYLLHSQFINFANFWPEALSAHKTLVYVFLVLLSFVAAWLLHIAYGSILRFASNKRAKD